MKFKFKIQRFQTDAAESIVQAFAGQPNTGVSKYRRDIGTVVRPTIEEQMRGRGSYLDYADKSEAEIREEEEAYETAYRNEQVHLTSQDLLKNIRNIQVSNNINRSSELIAGLGAVSLDVEMETGTGKTYVYIKTMFELYEKYGWSKFIVVVPSVAIREGVRKSFEMLEDHFMEIYGLKARYFVYDSSNLHQLDEYSQSSGINVMIINMQAFNTLSETSRNQAARIIYSKRDEFGSRRPIDVIKANRPIIILDEPQKMGGVKTQTALKNNFNPLFSLNFSATHKTSHNLVYVLDALDAYKKKLVKKIEVKGFELNNLTGTNCYRYLSSIVIDSKKPPRARLEFEMRRASGTIRRVTRLLDVGDSLYVASNNLEQYRGISIASIEPTYSRVTFSNGDELFTGEASGDVNEDDIRRIQIRETISSHFDKEEALFEQGIKCLSLFFIDEVAKYRQYDEDGEEVLGEYGRIFEEEYNSALNERLSIVPGEYQNYLRRLATDETHNGYFAIDNKGRIANSATGGALRDVSAYDLILKEKERLLSFEEPTRFIFSHSALREGWDNPNVFQICTLKHSDSEMVKRQEVGRGLRLSVNARGDRQDVESCGETGVHEINKLTVIASESYSSFVSDLQREIKADLYERPAKLEINYFTGKTMHFPDGRTHTFTAEEDKAAYFYFVSNQYVDEKGDLTETYKAALETDDLAPLSPVLEPYREGIHQFARAIEDTKLLDTMIGNAHETKIKDNPINENWEAFGELWEKINKRYAYTVEFDSDELIRNAVAAIDKDLRVAGVSYTSTLGYLEGVEDKIERTETKRLVRAQGGLVPYDLINEISKRTTLTRRTIVEILNGVKRDRLHYFALNPESFIQKVSDLINREKGTVVVEHITYTPSAEEPYSQEIFTMSKSSDEYTKAFPAEKAIQDYVFTDGTSPDSVERRFARDLDVADEVVVYAKLPSGPKGFYIPTPVGNYSPDWAISFKKGSVKHMFFIAETKGSMDSMELRAIEETKITCAKKLFNELSSSEVKYHEVDSFQTLLDVMDGI